MNIDPDEDFVEYATILASIFGTQGIVLMGKESWGMPFLAFGTLAMLLAIWAESEKQ